MTETTDAPATTPSRPASPLLERAGAVPAEGADTGVAWHYGDPTREQRQLVEQAAVVDLSHRGVVRVSGPDRRSWLHSLTTQHLSDLAPNESTEALVLSPHGHVEHSLHLVDDGEATWITVEPGTSDALVDWLRRMQFMLRVEVADLTGDWAVLGRPGRGEPGPAAPGEPPVWIDPWPALAPGSTSYAAVADTEHPPWAWREILVPRADLARRADEFGTLAGTWALDALRIEAWRPRLGFETDHRTIPHEVDWLRTAVHLQKGCYRGQETVARVHNLGRPPRRLVLLHLDGSEHELPGHGAPVVAGERQIGLVTTSARHHELGPIALALVKRSTPVDAPLLVAGVAAAQEVVVAP